VEISLSLLHQQKERIDTLKFDISTQYKGTGVSQGLDRGLLVYDDDILLLEEGMGLGACAFQTGSYTYFTSIKSIKKAEDSFKVVGSIDKKLVWKVLGIKSSLLTRTLEYITTNIYMNSHLTKEEIDERPIPDREGFDHKKYQELCSGYSGQRKASIMMTYGCPFSCDFCSKPIFGNKVRLRSLDKIFEEMGDIVSRGYNSLWIADDFFTFDAQFLQSFCNRLIEEDWQISWSCLSRVDSVTDDVAKMMKKSGCSKVFFGIESGNDYVLKLMNKKINTAIIRSGVEMFKSNGIACAGFFIVGYPGETVETIEETFDFALALGLDEISFNVPYPLPGSKLYERVSDISEDDWTLENETRFLYKSEFDEKWLARRIKETFETFKRLKTE